MDGFDAVNAENVDLMVETRGIAGAPAVDLRVRWEDLSLHRGRLVAGRALRPEANTAALDRSDVGGRAAAGGRARRPAGRHTV